MIGSIIYGFICDPLTISSVLIKQVLVFLKDSAKTNMDLLSKEVGHGGTLILTTYLNIRNK